MGIFRKDPPGRFVLVNPEFCRHKGMKAEEFLGKTPMEVAAIEAAKLGATGPAAKYAAAGMDHHEQIMQTGKPIELDEEYVTADGTKQFLHAIKLPILDSDGKIIGTQGIQFDITERKQAEEALARERMLLRTLIDNLPDCIYAKDSAGRKTMANPADLKNLRCKFESEAVGKSDFDLFPPDIAEKFWADDQLVLKGQPVLNREEFLFDEQGRKRWLMTSKLPLRDQNGKIIGLVGIGRDITKDKLAEEALARERSLLRTLIDNLPDCIYAKDAAGRKTLANPADLKNLHCKTEAEAIGKTDFDLFPQELAEKFWADDQKVIQGHPVINREEYFFDRRRQETLAVDQQAAAARSRRKNHRAGGHWPGHHGTQTGGRRSPGVARKNCASLRHNWSGVIANCRILPTWLRTTCRNLCEKSWSLESGSRRKMAQVWGRMRWIIWIGCRKRPRGCRF